MSVPYHKELFNNGRVKLMANFSNVKGDVADENISLNFYAVDNEGIPIFTEQLNVEEVRSLYNHLNSISVIRDAKTKSEKFIETSDEINLLIEQLKESDLETILTLLEKFNSDEKVKGLLQSLTDLEIENLHGAYHHRKITIEIANLEHLIELEKIGNITTEIKSFPELSKYIAGQPEKIFQNWIESNLWVFGVDYIKKYDVRKVGLFSEGDLLMQSVDGYLDLIELKRPNHKLLKYDSSHKCYYPHQDLSQVLGQSFFYLKKLEEYKLIIEMEYSVKLIMPRVKVIISNNSDFNDEERDALRIINTNLTSIQIITYNDLVHFGKLLLKNYEK